MREGEPRKTEEHQEPISLGAFIRQRRQELGLTRSFVGNASETSAAYLGKLERNEIEDPGFSKVCRVAKALSLDIGGLAERFGPSEAGRAVRGEVKRIHEENPDLDIILAVESGPGLDAIFNQLNTIELRGYLSLLKILTAGK